MNEATWIEKMRAVEGTLYHVTCALLREEYDRRDAMQETALRAWEKQSTLRKEEYFGTWAVRICINVCKDIRRKSKPACQHNRNKRIMVVATPVTSKGVKLKNLIMK